MILLSKQRIPIYHSLNPHLRLNWPSKLPVPQAESVLEASPTMPHESTYNITASETNPNPYNHNNGTTKQMLTRFVVSELCKGWCIYRDASEWKNFRGLFTSKHPAYVFTTWSAGVPIDEFVRVSIEGRANGDFIMHRENGTLVELNEEKERAIGKMKTTITQRFIIDGIPFDVENDCRFIFFCRVEDGDWKVQWKKVFYEKSALRPVDGVTLPKFDKTILAQYPEGYNYLALAQKMIGHKILKTLPTMNNEAFYKMNEAMANWLDGEDIDLFWESESDFE